ncbi:MAG: ATP-binding protein [Proteobacteria bacterium]|nr:ATP-binding protein [Pseudomonadota bacterium]
MILRAAQVDIVRLLEEQAAVTLLGPRQVGKTTLAHAIAATRPSVYFDLENPEDRIQLETPGNLTRYRDKLVVLDEIQRLPGLFEPIRGIIDGYRRDGDGIGKFLFLGSASIDLLRQTSESLAGRIAYRELAPLNVLETTEDTDDRLWLRGGFPDAFLARSDRSSMTWRRDFVRTYLERDIPQFDARVPGETLRRFWTMLAHSQGALLNASKLSSALAIDTRTLNRYMDLLVDLLLVRRLEPWHGNVKKRLVRSPKTYLRDSGIVHSLLNIDSIESLLSHPITGMSWEGHVIESILSVAPDWVQPYFFRTVRGAEIDLVLEFGPDRRWAIEIKRSMTPKPSPGFHNGCEDIGAERRFIVYAGDREFMQNDDVETLPLEGMLRALDSI